jgi:DNA-binding MarR family transcriptional regulator
MKNETKVNGVIGQVARIREQANLFIEQELRRVNVDGILPAHGAVLYFLFQQQEPVAIKEIVEKVGRVKSTVTGMIKTLELYGYLEKAPSPEDGRVMLVQLTGKGRAIRPQFEAVSARLQEKVYGDMAAADRQLLAGLLERILANLEK